MSLKPKVLSGLDVMLEEDFHNLKGARVGLLGHQASIASDGRFILDILLESENVNLVRIFAPEHGFYGALQDMQKVTSSVDLASGTEIVSLYGAGEHTLAPSTKQLNDIDILVVDLQDIGSRYYTFAQTLAYCMQTAGKSGTKVLVLDRPNPIGGLQVEGSILTNKFRSFVGYGPIANRHGLTMGELALIFQHGIGEEGCNIDPVDCDLEIVRMKGWTREMYFQDTGLPWVFPSPNMPTPNTALVYPGMCLFEGTNVSEGRGTTVPFELIGSPFIDDARRWIDAIYAYNVEFPGVILRPTMFIPGFQKSAGKWCQGIHLFVTDREAFTPYRLALLMIASLKKLCPESFGWRIGGYEFVTNIPAIDLLFGSHHFRKSVDTSSNVLDLLADLEVFETWFRAVRKDYLIYEKGKGV